MLRTCLKKRRSEAEVGLESRLQAAGRPNRLKADSKPELRVEN